MIVYNRLTGRKEEFVPVQPKKVSMYICGMTVQDRPHIGHIRSFMTGDIMRRYLEFRGYDVKHVQNFTDIDDKIIKRANEEKVEYHVVANRYIKEYYEVSDALNLLRAHVYPKATEEIDEIVGLIQRLVDQGFAYEVEGDVFFAVEKFPRYGALFGRKTEELLTGTRFDVDPKKRSPADFNLWKAVKPDEPFWETPFGKGRPGWHIECSAMAMKYLGETFDLHGGGLDLIFPHHENELAQAEAATGVPFVKYWVESGLLNIEGEKMSKSLGNFFAIGDILKKYSANEIRFFLVSNHYRSPLDFGEERLKEAQTAFKRISVNITKAHNYLGQSKIDLNLSLSHVDLVSEKSMADFVIAMDDDFNTAVAVSQVFELVKQMNILVGSGNDPLAVKEVTQSILGLCQILGFTFVTSGANTDTYFQGLMDKVHEWRNHLRSEKNWGMADRIRDDLKAVGIEIEDRPGQSSWKLL